VFDISLNVCVAIDKNGRYAAAGKHDAQKKLAARKLPYRQAKEVIIFI